MKSNTLTWTDDQTLETLRQTLAGGAVIAGSSDTVPGLLAPASKAGYDQLNAIKGRSEKPYLILIDAPDKLGNFVQMPVRPALQKLIDGAWPGPLTFILPARDGAPAWLAPAGKIAVRVPDHTPLRLLLEHFSGLFSTSANLAGAPVPRCVADIAVSIKQAVAALVDDQPVREPGAASTILDCTQDSVVVVREGAYPLGELERLYGAPFRR